MSWTWPCLIVVLAAGCSTGGDERPAMLGDCATCGQAPVSANGSSGVPEGGLGVPEGGIADVSNAGDVGLPDGLDIVDVGVGFSDGF